jgi:hypothetical protein
MLQTKVVKKIKTHILFNNFFPPKIVNDISTARQITDANKIRRMRIARWIPKATNTHSEYVIFIGFTLQQ